MRSHKCGIRSGSGYSWSRGFATSLTVAALMLTIPWTAAAQYAITRYTVDGGTVLQLVGGSYSLSGTAGQPSALTSTGGDYSVTGGFWFGGTGTVGVDESVTAPLSFRLQAVTPNPLIHEAVITFDLPESRSASLRIYDVMGRLTRTLAQGRIPAGRHRQVWDGIDDGGSRVGAGIYFVRFDAEADHARQKVIVIH